MMAKAEKCVLCGEDATYPRVLGKHGIYHLDCFKKSGELVGSAYAAPPASPPPMAVEEASLEPQVKKTRKRGRGKKGSGAVG